MNKLFKKRATAFLSALAVISSVATSAGVNFAFPENVSAVQNEWHFDFGANAQDGYTSVSADQAYNSQKGYGFRNTKGVKNVSASGSGALNDAVQFTDTANANNTFDVDLPNGLYQIDVTLGNTMRTSIHAENMLQIVNMTGNNAKDSITIPVTDGQLNIRATAGKEGYAFSISAIDIKPVSESSAPAHTVWLCGDSTVCNYYPLDTSVQGGWGQMLEKYVDGTQWQVRNMAASGQYAQGFLNAGQFDAIEYYGKEGDIYIISIGINDTNYSNETEYYSAVTDMVKRAKAKGMEVILVKQQGRATDVTNNPNLKGRWFSGTLDKIGQEQNVQVIDLFNLFFDHCKSIGQEATTALYMNGDTLHPNRQGAMKLAELASSQINWNRDSENNTDTPVIADDITDGGYYMIKNANSGLYLDVAGGSATNGTNVQQWGADSQQEYNTWQTVSAGDGYYYLYSQVGDNTFALDVTEKKADNGTNIEIYQSNKGDAQKFKFLKNADGTYTIVTKVSNDKSCIEVINAEIENGSNVQEWELNTATCQNWILEPVDKLLEPTEPPTEAPTTTETVTEPPAILTTTTVSEPQVTVLYGDANGDGKIAVADAVAISAYISNAKNNPLSEQGVLNADVHSIGNGVNASDALMIQQFATGIISVLVENPPEIVVPTEPQIPTEPEQNIYYAIDSYYNLGVEENTNSGFKGEAYVNLDNVSGSFIEWTVNAETAGNYLCTFNIANGSTDNRKMKVEVNGAADYWVQDFLSTSDWTSWNERAIVLPLNKGENKIKMTSLSESGGPNFDYLKLEWTEEPIAETYIPETTTPTENPVTDERVVYIAGDSTVQTYRASYAPQQGWGAYLEDYMPDEVSVSNQAIAGRSSKSFYDNGRLTTILDATEEGDMLLVQFGINDSAYNKEERYAPVCGTVPGTDGSFEFYIAKYIEGALEKGATPVLVTTALGLKAYNKNTGKFEGSYQNYCKAMKQLADYYKVPCIDLNSLMVDHYNAIGYDKAYTYHLISTELSDTDMTHFTETGANAVAKLVADEMVRLGLI